MPMRLRTEIPALEGATEWVNGTVNKEDLVGKPILVHFWAVSCYLCKESLPMLNIWREQYGAQYGLQVIGVHMPRSEKDTDIDAAKAVISEYELTHPVMIDNSHVIAEAFQNEYVPAFYLFDQSNQLRHFQAGEKGLKMVEQRLHKILGVAEEATPAMEG
jgi:thioredoxin-like negative regulator of GroEL